MSKMNAPPNLPDPPLRPPGPPWLPSEEEEGFDSPGDDDEPDPDQRRREIEEGD